MISILISFIGFMISSSTVPGGSALIHNGWEASPHEFPFMVILLLTETHNPYCAGTIISDSFILTAANCLYGYQLTDIFIQAGKHNLPAEEGFEQIGYASKFIIHEDYNYKELVSPDIGLIKLKSKLKFTKAAKPIGAFASKQSTPSDEGIMIGWGLGSNKKHTSYAQTLQKAIVEILPSDVCLIDVDYSENFICTEPMTGIGPCYGDSGAPLLQGEPGKRIVIGIASALYLQACGREVPSVFTKIYPYIHWIKENMR